MKITFWCPKKYYWTFSLIPVFIIDRTDNEIKINIPKKQHYITHIAQSSKSLLEAAFKMLKWCKENNLI